MDYASLLVHIPESGHRPSIIDAAASLSATFDAYLTALHVYNPVYPGYADSGAPAIWPTPASLQRRLEAAQRRDTELRAEFETRVKHLQPEKIEWRYQEPLSGPGLAHAIAAHARCADLVIMGQHDPGETPSQHSYGTPALVTLLSARPTLILPYASSIHTLGQHVVVAWNASREATGAVAAALPLLALARTVDIVVVSDNSGTAHGHGEEPGADIALYLARHGIQATVNCLSRNDLSVAEVLLSTVADRGADLLCMGAFGHSRLRELVFGGVTVDLLRDMTVPIFMAG